MSAVTSMLRDSSVDFVPACTFHVGVVVSPWVVQVYDVAPSGASLGGRSLSEAVEGVL